MTTLDILLGTFLLIFLVSLDLMAVGFSYGVSKTRVPLKHVIIISTIGSLMIGAALVGGYFVGDVVSETAGKITATVLFALVGFFKLVSWWTSKGSPPIKVVGVKEVIVLSFILSIDGIAVGFGAGLDRIALWFIAAVILVSLVTDILLFKLGQTLGKHLAKKVKFDLGWVAGFVFLMLAGLQWVL